MGKSILLFGVTLLAVIVFSCNNKNAEKQNTSSVSPSSENNKIEIEEELRAANDSLYAALNAMFTGDLEPMNRLWSHSENITDMGPFGGRLTGWSEVHEEFQKEAAMKFGGKITCKDLHIYAGTDMGYTVCVEEGENMSADGKPVVVNHRATNIFHLENGQWKLVHHQTDISYQLEKAFETKAK